MENQKVQDVLFEYLKNVIYSPERAHLDVDSLPEEFHDLGEGMLFLGKCVLEEKEFGKCLVRGDFEHHVPDVENGIAAPLKEVHGILKHLMWQSREVAKGDYSQHLDYFGELSLSFNEMVTQLRDREANLERKNRELMRLQEMFKTITSDAPYYIFSIKNSDHTLNYLNKKAESLKQQEPVLFQGIFDKLAACSDEQMITINDPRDMSNPFHYRVMSTSNPEDDLAIYMVMNVTDEFGKTLALQKMAYADELTGLYNRRYAQNTIKILEEQGTAFSLAFIDVDHLKYCNDVFGHEKGDDYILEVCHCLEKISGVKTICRVGGDEMTVIKAGIPKEQFENELRILSDDFRREYRNPFNKSFSFGVSEYKPDQEADISDVLTRADCNMQKYKMEHKQKIKYIDDRML